MILYILFYSFEFCIILDFVLEQAEIASNKIHSTTELFFFVFLLFLLLLLGMLTGLMFFKTLNSISFEEPHKLDVITASFTVSGFLSSSCLL